MPADGDTIECVHGGGFQLAQAEFAMATGGIGGTGLGQGSPQAIPFASTDFIFAAIGEELGMIGAVGVLLLFGVLVGKGLKVAVETQDGFGKLLATGPDDDPRVPGVHHRRRRDAGDPADRRDVTVRLLRGVEPAGELRPAGAARAHLGRARRRSRRRPLLSSPAEGPPISPRPMDDDAGDPDDRPATAAPTQVIR